MINTSNQKITHIDCFSGPGGICTGFKAAGIKTLLAIEKVESCLVTYKANHPEVPIIQKDIRDVSSAEIKKYINSDVDIITSGMPCETFSTAGSKSRSSYDHRQQLYSQAIRIAIITNAKLILFENVPGILSKKVHKNGDRLIVDDIFDELSKNGYKYNIQVILNARDFGIPQKRNRYFILASKEKGLKPRVPISKHNGAINVKDAFLDLPRVIANQKKVPTNFKGVQTNDYLSILKDNSFWKLNGDDSGLTYHIPPNHRKTTLERFKLIKPGEGLKDLFFKYDKKKVLELQKKRILPNKWYIQRNKRLNNNEPSKTVTSHCLDELLHPTQNRALTIREVARLQSFPDSYDFKGGPNICPHIYETQDKYEQIGDAVPPLLAYHWGLTIIELLNGL